MSDFSAVVEFQASDPVRDVAITRGTLYVIRNVSQAGPVGPRFRPPATRDRRLQAFIANRNVSGTITSRDIRLAVNLIYDDPSLLWNLGGILNSHGHALAIPDNGSGLDGWLFVRFNVVSLAGTNPVIDLYIRFA